MSRIKLENIQKLGFRELMPDLNSARALRKNRIKIIDPLADNRRQSITPSKYGEEYAHIHKCIGYIASHLSLNNLDRAQFWANQLCMPKYVEKLQSDEGKPLRAKIRYLLSSHDNIHKVAQILFAMLLENNMKALVYRIAADTEVGQHVRELAIMSLAEKGEYESLAGLRKSTMTKSFRERLVENMRGREIKVPDGWEVKPDRQSSCTE